MFVINLFATITVCVLYWSVAKEREAKRGWFQPENFLVLLLKMHMENVDKYVKSRLNFIISITYNL